MADEQNKGYGDKKLFICTGCGKEVMLTKFASQKTCKCDDCKTNNTPINPDIVAKALSKNPPKERKQANATSGATKIRPCIKCGKDTEVSKFMSDQKVMCDGCKGVDNNTQSPKGIAQRISVDISKLDKSKILPIEEYEVNEVCIRNSRLRSVKCPACGHEYMKPNMVIDWSQFGLIISYQCPECLATMTVSEQADRLIKRHSPGTRFDYTGREIEGMAYSSVEQSRHINIIRKLIKQLEEHNIKIDDVEVIPFRWKNEKPVPIGYEIPDYDKLLKCVGEVIDILDSADKIEESVQIPLTLANKLSKELKDILKGD